MTIYRALFFCTLASLGEIAVVDFPDIDLSQERSTQVGTSVGIDTIINALAYTSFDKAEKAESKPELAMKIDN